MIKKILLMAALFPIASTALNSIHDAHYTFFPYALGSDNLIIGSGGYWNPDNGLERLPLRFSGNINPDFEVGGRLNFDAMHGDWRTDSLRTTLDLGATGLLRNFGQVAADVIIPMGQGGLFGANFSYTKFVGHKDMGMAGQIQVAFGPMVGDKNLAMVEFGAYPWYQLFPHFDLISELSYSTSPIHPEINSALDWAPGIRLGFGRWTLVADVNFGVAGDKKGDPYTGKPWYWKTIFVYDFK